MNHNYIQGTFKGSGKSSNQDRIFIGKNSFGAFFFLFDGVSSSKKCIDAINVFIEYLKTEIQNINHINISSLIYEGNLITSNKLKDGYFTITGVILTGEKCLSFNVGDSRVYIKNKTKLSSVHKDDVDPLRQNILTKYGGSESLHLEDISLKSFDLREKVLICSDGFYNIFDSIGDLYKIINYKNLETSKKHIENFIQSVNNSDDATYILISYY